MFSRLRHLGAESKRLRHLAAGFTDGAVIVHDQEVQEICSLELRRMAMTVTEDGGGRGGKHRVSPWRRRNLRRTSFLRCYMLGRGLPQLSRPGQPRVYAATYTR